MDECTQQILKSFKKHSKLEKLYLRDNALSSYDDLIELIKTNDVIKSIDLRANYINENKITQIREGLS